MPPPPPVFSLRIFHRRFILTNGPKTEQNEINGSNVQGWTHEQALSRASMQDLTCGSIILLSHNAHETALRNKAQKTSPASPAASFSRRPCWHRFWTIRFSSKAGRRPRWWVQLLSGLLVDYPDLAAEQGERVDADPRIVSLDRMDQNQGHLALRPSIPGVFGGIGHAYEPSGERSDPRDLERYSRGYLYQWRIAVTSEERRLSQQRHPGVCVDTVPHRLFFTMCQL